MKVVVNRFYGGFGLSSKAMHRYGEIAGFPVFEDKSSSLFSTYWKVPNSERPKEIKDWSKASMKERKEFNEAYNKSHFYDKYLERNDPILIQIVGELGKEANGQFAVLEIVEVPDNVDYEIEEYDGREWVAEKHRTW